MIVNIMLPPFKHQEKARDLLWNHGAYALIMEQGTGKSRPVIEDWLARMQGGWAQDLVVLAPKGCYTNWIGTPDDPGEIRLWVPEEVLRTLNIGLWISGTSLGHRSRLNDLLHAKGPRFLCMNIEAL